MDLIESPASSIEPEVADLCAAVRDAASVVPVGARTQWAVGEPPVDGLELRAPVGVLRYDAADLTVTVAAGTPVATLAKVLSRQGQECPLDPRHEGATIGGVLSTGLSGYRRLRHGPLRNWVLEVRFVNARGDVVKGGGPTVKNVSGYDLPRLLVGSLGTIGLLTQVTLRAQPLPSMRMWTTTERSPDEVRDALFRPVAILWDGRRTCVRLEGEAADVTAQSDDAALDEGAPPTFPAGPHRGRISVAPGRVPALRSGLDQAGVRWLAEVGVGTVHVAADDVAALAAAREVAAHHGGWMLREAGAPQLDPFGIALPNRELLLRVKTAFDPDGKMNPGRLSGLDPRPAAKSS